MKANYDASDFHAAINSEEMRLPFERLTIAQLRRVLAKCGKNYAGLSKKDMMRLCCALIGQAE